MRRYANVQLVEVLPTLKADLSNTSSWQRRDTPRVLLRHFETYTSAKLNAGYSTHRDGEFKTALIDGGDKWQTGCDVVCV